MINDVLIEDLVIPDPGADVHARRYRAAAPKAALVWIHGGAFCFGDLDMPEGDWVARWFASQGYEVLSVDYRLAPVPEFENFTIGGGGHPFPAAHEDIVVAFDWMTDHVRELGLNTETIVLGGASAGGNLAAGAAVALRDRALGVPGALLLAYPLVHSELPPAGAALAALVSDLPSTDRFLPGDVRLINLNYVGGAEALLNDPRAFPGSETPRDLPRTFIVNSEADDLRSSGELYAEQLTDGGVEVQVTFEPGARHGHLNRPDEPFAERTLRSALTWLNA